MPRPEIPKVAADFMATYDADAKDAVWLLHRDQFRSFWSGRVLARHSSPLTDDECDAIIRILDRNAKGNTKNSEAVARAMVPQGAWRRLFREFRSNEQLGDLLKRIFEEEPAPKAALIDQLYELNKGKGNNLTGQSGNTINAFLAAYDPVSNLSIISLNDRHRLIQFFGLSLGFNWDDASTGTRVVESNAVLLEGIAALGVTGSARTKSRFCYCEGMRPLWKDEHTVKRPDKSVSVTIPSERTPEGKVQEVPEEEIRESLQIQACLAEIGSRMGLKIWLPKSDRVRVLKRWNAAEGDLLNELPLSYDHTTLKTIEQIDVLWLKKRSIVRAFEVEHTTSVYSGLLRMADLLALQPNMKINLHIVAPASKREKVFQEIRRPVFSLLEGGALSESCTYLSYESVKRLREEKHLDHLSDAVIGEYEEQS